MSSISTICDAMRKVNKRIGNREVVLQHEVQETNIEEDEFLMNLFATIKVTAEQPTTTTTNTTAASSASFDPSVIISLSARQR